MHSRSVFAIVLATVIALPASAHDKLSQASVVAGSVVLAVPFSVVYLSGAAVSVAANASESLARSWKVAKVQPRGPRTDLELRCDDKQVKLNMTIDSRIAQEQHVQVGDQLDIDAIGKTGYTVRKGQATVAILTEPGAGMVHSKARG